MRLLPVGVFVCLLRETLEVDPLYADLWLEGEISDLSRSAAGHTYFSLRDDDGLLKCVLFRGQALRQHQPPRLGDQVAVHGGLSVYPRSGSLQMVVDLVRPAGLGAAMLDLARLRQRLELEGLFDERRKRTLPTWPRTIGVVTSAHGAAWQDIQQVIGRRFPFVTLVLSPALVQGLGAAQSITAALESLQLIAGVDVVILARGGGANDDLAAFNEELVARAVFASRVPVVTGIGHASDRTLVEDVADVAAPTPSAAAELTVPSIVELSDRANECSRRLTTALAAHAEEARTTMDQVDRRLLSANPRVEIVRARSKMHRASRALGQQLENVVARSRQQVTISTSLLASLDPQAVLSRGYAAIHNPSNRQPIFSTTQVRPGSHLAVTFLDGSTSATVDGWPSVPERGASPE